MKAETKIAHEGKRLKALLAPLDEETERSLLPFQRLAVAVGEARIELTGGPTPVVDVVSLLLDRGISLCTVLTEMVENYESEHEFPRESAAGALDILREDLEVLRWIARRQSAPGA
jgi:hypothetical protein